MLFRYIFPARLEVGYMEKRKIERLQAGGWKVGTVAEFLNLTPEETALIEIKLALSNSLKERRTGQMTQAELAHKIKSVNRESLTPKVEIVLYQSSY